MSGIKGRSGRKSRHSEATQGNLEKLCHSYLVDNFESFDRATKLRISLSIASKMVTQKVESTSEVTQITKEQSQLMLNHINRLAEEN